MSQIHEVLSVLETKFTKMQNGTSQREILEFHDQAVMWCREEVSRLCKRSPWVRSYDYIVRLLLRSLLTIVERIKVVYGSTTECLMGAVYTNFGHPATCSFRVNDIFQNGVFDPFKIQES